MIQLLHGHGLHMIRSGTNTRQTSTPVNEWHQGKVSNYRKYRHSQIWYRNVTTIIWNNNLLVKCNKVFLCKMTGASGLFAWLDICVNKILINESSKLFAIGVDTQSTQSICWRSLQTTERRYVIQIFYDICRLFWKKTSIMCVVLRKFTFSYVRRK